MKIRKAVIDDFIAIHLLNSFGLGYDYPTEKTKKRLAYILSLRGAKFLVAEVDDIVVGYIHAVDYDCTYSDPVKDILALAVDEEYRRKGVGLALVAAIEKWAYSTGACGVRLVTSSLGKALTGFMRHAATRSGGNKRTTLSCLRETDMSL